jgi:hypothetical protein
LVLIPFLGASLRCSKYGGVMPAKSAQVKEFVALQQSFGEKRLQQSGLDG